MLKLIIWMVAAAMLLVSWHLVASVWAFKKMVSQIPYPPGAEGGSGIVMWAHDTWIRVGPFRGSFYPRPWAATLVVVGMALVIIGLIFLLHVKPSSPQELP